MVSRNKVGLSFWVIHDWNRAPPIALAAYQPVAYTVLRNPFATDGVDDTPLSFLAIHAREITGIRKHASVSVYVVWSIKYLSNERSFAYRKEAL